MQSKNVRGIADHELKIFQIKTLYQSNFFTVNNYRIAFHFNKIVHFTDEKVKTQMNQTEIKTVEKFASYELFMFIFFTS